MNSNRNDKRQSGFFGSLIGEPTPVKISGLTYTMAALVFLALSLVYSYIPAWEGDGYIYLRYLLSPLAFLLVGAWYFGYTKTPLKSFFKEQACSPKYYFIAVLLQIGLLSLSELNALFLKFLQRFGYVAPEIVLPSVDGFGFVGVLLTVAVLPALLEEFVFRGLQLRGMKEFGAWQTVLISGALFALFHQSPAQTVYQFICVAAFALVAVRSGSFLPTALAHFINNAYIIVLYKLGITSFPVPVYAIILCVSAVCLVGSLVYLILFDKKKTEEKTEKKGYGEFFACAGLGIGVYLLSWSAALLAGA